MIRGHEWMSVALCTAFAATSLGLLACGDDGATGGAGGDGGGLLDAPSEDQGFQLQLDPLVPGGGEVHLCREFVVPGEGEISIERFETSFAPGMHHILAYRTNKSPAEAVDEVFDCGEIPGQIFYAESADAPGAQFPEGVGIKLNGGDVIRMELHALNVENAEALMPVRLNALYAKTPLTSEAGSFFMYDRDIAIPAQGSFTARMHCEIPSDIEILTILPHVHVRGTAQRMWVSGGDLAEPKLFLETKGYADQEARKFAPGELSIKQGQFLDFECDYENPTALDIVEGPSKDLNEMCMLLGDYYPRMAREGEWCTLVGSGPVMDGSHDCGEAFQALNEGLNLDFAAEVVMTSVCSEALGAWNDLGNCGFNNCADVCPGPQCNDCAGPKCVDEFVACQAAKCEPQ